MYFWNYKALAEQLKKNKITEREKMHYLFIYSLFEIIIHYLPVLNKSMYFLWLTLATTCFGIKICFDANRHGDDKFFLDRFICLGLPIGIRQLIYTILTFVIVFILLRRPHYMAYGTFKSNISSQETIIIECITLGWMIWYYLKLKSTIKSVAE